jgi:hypothetical protein
MNTKTISPFVSIRYNLWKDFHQIWTVILAVIGGITLIQLTFIAARSLVELPMIWNNLIETTLTLAGVGSLLTIVGSAAMMIGHERQTGTWGWASSLPASWAQTLASKLIVSFASSVLVGLALCCTPLAVYTLRRSDIPFSLPDSTYYLTTIVAVFFQAWAFFYLATLLFKDPMTGMVCAGIVSVLIQIVAGAWGIEYRATESSTLILAQTSITLIAFGGMIGVYRWRWRMGQHSEFSLRRENVSYVVPAKCVYVVSQPSEWRMLLSLSAQNMFVFRVLLAVSSTLFLAWLSSLYVNTTGFVLAVMSLGFGSTAFMGDQANGRFRFLADRGVHPMALVTSRLAVPGGWLLLCLFIAVVLNAVLGFFRPIGVPTYWNDLSVELFFVWCVIISCCFSVGALASLCFRQPIIACFSAGVVSIMTAVLYGVMADSIHGDWNLFWIWMNALIWMTFVPFLLLFVTYRFARKWIVSDRLSLFSGFTAICGLSMFFPFFLSATFSFWMVPSIPNAELLMAQSDFDTESLPPLEPVLDALALNLERSPDESTSQYKSRLTEQSAVALAKARKAFSEPKITKRLDPNDLLLMHRLIVQSAELASKLAQNGCVEESSKAWTLCGMIQQQCGPRLAWLTTASRNRARSLDKEMMYRLSESFGSAISMHDVDSVRNATKWMQAKANVDALRGIVSDSPTAFRPRVTRPLLAIYPPIRWRLEREAILRAVGPGAASSSNVNR